MKGDWEPRPRDVPAGPARPPCLMCANGVVSMPWWKDRVVYFFHSEDVPTFLLTLFAKNEKDNLSMAERNQLAAFVEELKKHFKR